MGRNESADEFVNCVARRGDLDMYLKPSLMLCITLIPLILGSIAAAVIFMYNMGASEHLTEEMRRTLMVCAFVAFTTELSIVSFLIFCITRSNYNHLSRDITWMESLCGYVDSYGKDSSKMRDILKRTRKNMSRPVKVASSIIWTLSVAVLLVIGFTLLIVRPIDDPSYIIRLGSFTLIPMIVLTMLQFLATLGMVFSFPSVHDHRQSEFTKELQTQCAGFGLRVDAMKHTVPRRLIIVHLFLTLITLGLYSPIYLLSVCRSMNKHLLSQWRYEEKLMEDIIGFEGGVGIEATSEGKKGGVSGLIDRLL